MKQKIILAGTLALTLLGSAQASIELNKGTLSYGQNFNSLASSNGSDPAWTNNSSLAGWSLFAGPALNQTVSNLRVSTSSGSDRAHISYGSANAADRALGMQGGSSHRYSANAAASDGENFGAIGVAFVNAGASTLDGFSFSYTGEQWHVSSNANTAHNLRVQYALGAAGSSFQSQTWKNLAGANFVSPVTSGGTSGDGNLAANRVTGLGASVTGLQWQTGQTLWLRWVDTNDRSSDHGLAIDDFSFNASVSAVPEPQSWLLMGLGLLAFAGVQRARRS
ncbi:PEP-CTERM sorting domain-containing protein [Roseateles sp.]|uniref:PEP-CTERM sorting domain-containing protein n=1 Tax=Roseateles sp. TaxID=1971397 RepID=UPI003BAB266B